MTQTWFVNGRFRGQMVSGVQRVAAAYLARINTPHTEIEPAISMNGMKGHAWEQFLLPRMARDRPVWCPCNTGPISVSQQVVTIHDAAVFDHPEWFSRGFAALYHLLLPRLARRCLKITTVSAFSRARLADRLGIDAKKIEVIWNGVDEHFFPVQYADVDAAKTAIGFGGERYFASLSTLEPRKNLTLVLRAWAAAQPHLPPDTKLLVIGKKGDASVFRDAPTTSFAGDENVVYTGYVDDKMLPALLTGAQALLYPSLYEGFGLPVVEAMACATPVMTTARASLPEIAGDAAIYVDADDPEDLAKHLVRLTQSAEYREEYSGRGLQRAKLFQWSVAAGQMDGILAALA